MDAATHELLFSKPPEEVANIIDGLWSGLGPTQKRVGVQYCWEYIIGYYGGLEEAQIKDAALVSRILSRGAECLLDL